MPYDPSVATFARPPTQRLAFRIALALCTGAAAILGIAGGVNLHLQRVQLTHLVSVSGERIAETIGRSTREMMLRDDRDGLHRTIATIGAQQGIARIRVFNKEGAIRTSTDASEVGRVVDKRAEQCDACHETGRPLERLPRTDRVRIFRAASGERVLGVIAPIQNETQCVAACHAHPASQRVLGVLDVQLSLATVDDSLRISERQMIAGVVATGAAVLALAGALVWRMVLRPLRRLWEAMAAVSAGDLQARVPVTSRDELGAMAAGWNRMTDDLRRTRQELEGWNEGLERRVAEKTAALNDAHQRMLVVEKRASLGQLAAVVAHEINNPLAGIRTYARLLRRRLGEGDPETGRILAVIDDESGRCGAIVRDLLLMSRSSPARLAEEDLAPVVERCRALVRHQAELLGVELRLETEVPLPSIVCDASQIEQMLLALALNALEATPSGGRVTIGLARDGGTGVVFTVADTGSGIPPEIRERIFEPFFTTKEMGQGVGLGLAVVHGIVARHQGRIELDSEVGAGTVFRIHLPIRPSPLPADTEAS